MADDILRIANVSGFYGDRRSAMREMSEGGPVDVITGDYLAELTMLILWRAQQRDPALGYARSFLRQFREVVAPVADRGIRIVVNAGGLAPDVLARAIREVVSEAGVQLRVAHIEGDDLRPLWTDAGSSPVRHLTSGEALPHPPLTANAYLGAWGIAEALRAGADVVVTGRVSDASLTVGPGIWRFGWGRDDLDALAGAVVAGHVIECGTQAAGGNYAFFTEIDDLTSPGFPLAELHPDGSSVITKHPGTGGRVDIGTVTAQLLYEIGGAAYLSPDATARFDTISLHDDGTDRVAIRGVRGAPPPDTTKVSVTTLGGFRNQVEFVLTGLDIPAKAALVRQQLAAAIDLDALDEVVWQLVRTDHLDAADNAAATATLRCTVHHHEPELLGRQGFAAACVELGLASYPGFTLTAPPADAEPFSRFIPGRVPATIVEETVVLPGDERRSIAQSGALLGRPTEELLAEEAADATAPPAVADRWEPTLQAPLGTLAGARSGDKGGDANVGLWVRDPDHLPWLHAVVGTPERVRSLLPEAEHLDIEVVSLPNLLAVNVVIRGLLGDGVASATRPDPQAKGLGEYLRSRYVPIPRAWLPDARTGDGAAGGDTDDGQAGVAPAR